VTDYWCELAWLGGATATAGVLLRVDGDRFAAVTADVQAPPADAERLAGLTLPALANAHSHAFHRALRGRTQVGTWSFWTWREQMYRAAARLTPERYYRLARAVFGEMALAGLAVVGEFHYVHHQPDGTPYDDPNAMGLALLEAARDAGVRLTLLDTLYLHGGLDASGYRELSASQRRFGDRDVESWAARVEALPTTPTARIGAAAHSVRAVDPDALRYVAAWSVARGAPLHIHLSEQALENEQCRALHGCSPTELLDATGVLGAQCTAVHATHVDDDDIERLGVTRTRICACPTTERDLADGIGPFARLRAAGCTLAIGTDSHAVIDGFEEARAIELDERLATGCRGTSSVEDLLVAATSEGCASVGWSDTGRLTTGALADFVTVGLDSVRLTGTNREAALASVLYAATAADVTDVVVGGNPVVRGGVHARVDVAPELAAAIADLMDS
jgi:formiminoglutamate deiminase